MGKIGDVLFLRPVFNKLFILAVKEFVAVFAGGIVFVELAIEFVRLSRMLGELLEVVITEDLPKPVKRKLIINIKATNILTQGA